MRLYAQLLLHRWRHWRRGGAARPEWVKRLILAFFGVYLAGSLATIGYIYPRLMGVLQPGLEAAAVANSLMFSALFGLLVLRFFTQRSTKMQLTPYVARPLPRRPLVRFVQGASLVTLLNVFAPAFIVPLWHQTFWHGPFSATGALAWLGGVGLFIIVTHYVNDVTRLLLAQRTRAFIGLAATTAVLLGLDSLLGTRALTRLSTAFFEGLLQERLGLLALPASLLVMAWVASGRLLRHSLRSGTDRARASWTDIPAVFSAKRGTTRNLMLLELKLIARNRRPSTLVGISALLIVTYVPLLLLGRGTFPLIDAVTGLFVTGLLAASYGQLMFAWDSLHFDGLLVRPLQPRTQLRAKLLLLQVGCVASLVVALPFFIWLAPDLLLLSVGFLLYNLGITCPFVLFFSLWNRKRLTPQGSGFFNYEGLSMQHWIGSLPVFLPPLVLVLVFEESWVLLAVSVLGVLGMALLPTWTRLCAHLFTRHRHAMAAGFRRDE